MQIKEGILIHSLMKVSELKNDVHCGYESNWVYDRCLMLIQSLISAEKQLDSVSNRV